jgi:hypothetical protein
MLNVHFMVNARVYVPRMDGRYLKIVTNIGVSVFLLP